MRAKVGVISRQGNQLIALALAVVIVPVGLVMLGLLLALDAVAVRTSTKRRLSDERKEEGASDAVA